VCWRWVPRFDIGALALVALVLIWACGRHPGSAALYGFVFGAVFAGSSCTALDFGIVAIVPLVAEWRRSPPERYWWMPEPRRSAITVVHRSGVGRAEALRAAGRSVGCVGDWRGVHDSAARAVRAGGVALVSFVLVVNSYLVDLGSGSHARAAID